MEISTLKKRIQVASGAVPADLVIKNGKIIDVFNQEIMTADLAIADGVIAGIGEYEGNEVIDAESCFISPGLIDAHVHIESSMVAPSEFAKIVLPHGVTTVIADPHEIANVLGEEGIAFMLDDSEGLDLDVYLMLPSCVPAAPFEHAGAVLLNEQLLPFYRHPRVLGLAEIMDYPGVKNTDSQMMDKLASAAPFKIDGHGAGLDQTGVNVFAAAGIQTDHECITQEQAKERLARGMYVMIREGSAAKNLKALIPAVHEKNSHRCLFCTDDKHINDLIAEGSIDHNIRLAILEGLNPLTAVQMATLNAAQCFGLVHKGALAPGYDADFILVEDLQQFTIKDVFKAGKRIGKNGSPAGLENQKARGRQQAFSSTVNIPAMSAADLSIPVFDGQKACVIEIIPNQIETRKKVMEVPTAGGQFMPSSAHDLAKMAVIERHHGTGNIGLAIVKGLGLKNGALAATIAHDSHNLIVAGDHDEDMLAAIETLKTIGGGLAVTHEGKLLAALPLPIAGLMTGKSGFAVAEDLSKIYDALQKISVHQDFNLFLTLSFLSLPVIPELKLTDSGLFDAASFSHIPVVFGN
ncbi:adenine deaminase [Heyndrickxia acidiproducens]|uniref:adenine deaminase n=1 Tax=Heyndrickxia acidiproducens TaxID=1121084 RepID=UPI00037C2A4D|nr:adenine deaminase [Heyndrickxia acidiproducens]